MAEFENLEEQRDGLLAPRVPAAVVLGELHLDWCAGLRAAATLHKRKADLRNAEGSCVGRSMCGGLVS